MDLYTDLLKWRKKAKRAPNAAFESAHIPPWMVKALRFRLGYDPAHAFDPLVLSVKALRSNVEIEFAEALERLWQRKLQGRLRGLLAEGKLEIPAEYAELVIPQAQDFMATFMADELLRQAAAINYEFDYGTAIPHIAQWANDHAGQLIDHLADTDQKVLGDIVAKMATNELTYEEGVERLGQLFTPQRARTIAATELTAASAAASDHLQVECAMSNIDTVLRWETEEDERTCPRCGPLDHTLEAVWREVVPNGPPVHVGCRCRLVVERRRAPASPLAPLPPTPPAP